MSDPKLDARLSEYLDDANAQKSRGHTIANLSMGVFQLGIEVRNALARLAGAEALLGKHGAHLARHDDEIGEVRERLDEHGHAIRQLKRRNRQGPDDEEMQTGQFDVAAIKRQVDEQERQRRESLRARAEDRVWWKRTIVMWAAGGIGAVALTLLSILLTLAVTRK